MNKTVRIERSDIEHQNDICHRIAEMTASWDHTPLAMVDTYGCQQNEADSEKIRGMLREMGCDFTDDENKADVVVLNTCAVREHAEQRVFGNVGALTHTKRRNPNQKIIVCGCMAQQPQVAERLKNSFRHVDMVIGPHALWRFPEYMEKLWTRGGRIFHTEDSAGSIAEGLPQSRDGKVKAWLSVMYGCNNFCSYCIVPYVRGRERSREPDIILDEAKSIVSSGYKDITLLGQNVNSYGKDLDENIDFSELIRRINDIPGEFIIRFMTSHPKDAGRRLFETIASCEKAAHHIHLPFQAGNNRVLKAMNRGYTKEKYLELIVTAREIIPDVVLTSDIIVGFPGETAEEFEDTLDVLEKVRFDSLFTFIYSPRPGTPAAAMDCQIPKEEKNRRFDKLIALQNQISSEKHRDYIGKTFRVLIDGRESGGALTSRTSGGRLVRLSGDDALIGSFADVKITDSNTWALQGELI